jgi:alpha-L-fucosidase 2
LHPPFQIDGNFGATSGIAEMLLQCKKGEILLLPALPAAWKEGSVRGLLARGAFSIDLTWKQGMLASAKILSHAGSKCTIRCANNTVSLATIKGRTYHLNGSLEPAAGR